MNKTHSGEASSGDERGRFEAALKLHCGENALTRFAHERTPMFEQGAWWAWQARASCETAPKAAEPVAWQGRRYISEPDDAGWLNWREIYPVDLPLWKRNVAKDSKRYEVRPLYLAAPKADETGPMSTDKTRQAFEEWAVKQKDAYGLPYFIFATTSNGNYLDGGATHAWKGWQAASEASPPPQAAEARDAARYRFIRDVPYTENIRLIMRSQSNAIMDGAIDAAIESANRALRGEG